LREFRNGLRGFIRVFVFMVAFPPIKYSTATPIGVDSDRASLANVPNRAGGPRESDDE
jgi:hypothetical protein